MPFKGTSAMDQKTRFIADYLTGFFSHTELCHSYGISRPTGYKWIDRYEAEGSAGLVDRSRCPHHCPQETPREIVAAIVELRKQKGLGPEEAAEDLVRSVSCGSATGRIDV
jgi:putative transposase